MSPEIALAAILALLFGPTAIWLALRAMRGGDGQRSGTFTGESAGWLAPAEPQTAVLQDFWLCRSCSSVNHHGATRCYGCMLARDEADPERVAAGVAAPPPAVRPDAIPAPGLAPPDPTTSAPWVPVMDPAAATAAAVPDRGTLPHAIPDPEQWDPEPGSDDGLAAVAAATSSTTTEDVAVTAAVAAATPTARETRRRPGRSSRALHPVAAPVEASAVEEDPVAPPQPQAPPARPIEAGEGGAVAPVPATCPFFGMKDDRASHYDFPDPRNACYAQTGRSSRFLGRGGGHAGRSQAVELDTQASLCLSTTHAACARYVAATTAANR